MSKPTIIEAAKSKSPLTAALKYLELGINPLPLQGKKPHEGFTWSLYQRQKVEYQNLLTWDRWGWFKNVGVICGTISNNLVVIDLDGIDTIVEFQARFAGLAFNTFNVLSGSGKGKHVYLYVDKLPKTTRVRAANGNIEVRAEGCYVVAPPSIHPDTFSPYFVQRDNDIKQLPNIDGLMEWLGSLAPKPTPAVNEVKPTIWFDRWTRAALDNEVDGVHQAVEGTRNDRLNLAAFKMGQLIVTGRIDRATVESELLSAALAVGLPENESRRTITSGIEGAARKPIYRRM